MGRRDLHFFEDRSVHIPLPQISFSPVVQSCPFQVSVHPSAQPQPQPKNGQIIAHEVTSPSEQREQPGTLLDVLATGRMSLHHALQGSPGEGRWWRSCLLSGGFYVPCRTICPTGLSLLFVCQLTFDSSPGRHGSGWEREDAVAGVGTVGTCATCPYRACSGLITCVPLPFGDGVLPSVPNFAPRWDR